MKKAATLAVIVVAATLLSACIGVESNVTFKADGSGVLKLEYRMSKMLTEAAEGGSAEVPLPASEEDFTTAIEGTPVKLLRISNREDEQDVYMGAELGFQKIEDITEIDDFDDMPMSLERSGGDFVFRQRISEGAGEGESEKGADEMEAMLKEMFQGYELVFVVTAPRKVKSHNLGELSADGRTVRYAMPVFEMSGLKEETVLTVVW